MVPLFSLALSATAIPRTPQNPCYPGKCGTNARCRVHNGLGVCSCEPDHFGNPYEACRPECVVHSDCDRSKACERTKCVDPCPGVCGLRAECRVHNHVPMCYCLEGYRGDPFTACTPIPSTRKTFGFFAHFGFVSRRLNLMVIFHHYLICFLY